MSLTTVLGITVLGHHRVNRSLRTSANLDFANRNCFDLLVKIIVTAPIARGSSLKSPLDADVVSPLAVLAKIPVRAGTPAVAGISRSDFVVCWACSAARR